MKKIILAILLLSSISSYANDTIATTVKELKFKTIQTNDNVVKVVILDGKEYIYSGSQINYRRQIRMFGDCRILIINNKIIIL